MGDFINEYRDYRVNVKRIQNEPGMIDFTINCDWASTGADIDHHGPCGLIRFSSIACGIQEIKIFAFGGDSKEFESANIRQAMLAEPEVIDIFLGFSEFLGGMGLSPLDVEPKSGNGGTRPLIRNNRPHEGSPSSQSNNGPEIIPDQVEVQPEFEPQGGLYGTERDLKLEDIKRIVARCRNFQERGGKIPDFHRQLVREHGGAAPFALETLRGYLKDPKYRSSDT